MNHGIGHQRQKAFERSKELLLLSQLSKYYSDCNWTHILVVVYYSKLTTIVRVGAVIGSHSKTWSMYNRNVTDNSEGCEIYVLAFLAMRRNTSHMALPKNTCAYKFELHEKFLPTAKKGCNQAAHNKCSCAKGIMQMWCVHYWMFEIYMSVFPCTLKFYLEELEYPSIHHQCTYVRLGIQCIYIL